MAKLYNEFDYTDYQWKNTNFMLEELGSLKAKGVNIDLPVVFDRKFIPFIDYLKQKGHEDLYIKLMEKDLIENTCKFSIEAGVVKEGKNSLIWMGENFKQYQEVILNAIGDLAAQLENNPASKIKLKDLKGQIQTYDKEPVLFTMMNKLLIGNHKGFMKRNHNTKVWDKVLSQNQDIRRYMNNQLQSHKQIEQFFSMPRHSYFIGEIGLASVFYKHGIAKNYFHNNTNRIAVLLMELVRRDEIKSVKELMKIYLHSDKLNSEDSHYMLANAKSSEMANFLLEVGCPFVIKDKYKPENYSCALNNDMPKDVIKTIIEFKYSHKEYLQSYPEDVFNNFFKLHHDFDKMKTLVECGFKIDKFDMLDIGYKLAPKDLKYSKWFLENGAKAENCEDFATTLARNNKEMKVLDKYKEIMDIYSGDFIYQALNKGGFADYKDTLTLDMLDRKTAKDVPAWWGGRLSTSLIASYINQPGSKILDTQTDSWLAHMHTSHQFDSAMSWCTQYRNNLLNEKLEKYPLKFDNDKNIFHHMFNPIYDKDIEVRSDVLKFLLEETDINLKNQMLGKDNDGKNPLFLLLDNDDYDPNHAYRFMNTKRYQVTKKILQNLEKDFPFEEKINDKTAIEIVKIWTKYDYDDFDVEPLYRAYLSQKIGNSLPEKEQVKKKIKI